MCEEFLPPQLVRMAFLGHLTLVRQLLHNTAPAAGHSPTNALINLTSRK